MLGSPGAEDATQEILIRVVTSLSTFRGDSGFGTWVYRIATEVFASGDIALHIAPWKMTGQAPDGTPFDQNGLSVAVFRRQADGAWKMVIDNPNGDALLE